MLRRDRFDLEGVHADASTWKADATLISAVAAAGGPATVAGRAVAEGKAVTITGNMIAGFGSAGDPLLGKIEHYHYDNVMTIQDVGYTEMPGVSGNLPTAGAFVVVDGNGAVMASTGAVGPARAVSVNNTANVNTVMVLIG
jgi:hypothetical protein